VLTGGVAGAGAGVVTDGTVTDGTVTVGTDTVGVLTVGTGTGKLCPSAADATIPPSAQTSTTHAADFTFLQRRRPRIGCAGLGEAAERRQCV
jgi:hypothetical protein